MDSRVPEHEESVRQQHYPPENHSVADIVVFSYLNEPEESCKEAAKAALVLSPGLEPFFNKPEH